MSRPPTAGRINARHRRRGRTLRGWIRTNAMAQLHLNQSPNGRPNDRALSGKPDEPTALDITMMRRAIELARKAADLGEVPIGALVHRDGEVIAEAHNLVEQTNDPTGHAEARVIRDAARRLGERRLNECTLVVTLEPCTMCAGAIVLGRVGRVVYGATDPKAGAIESVFSICSSPRLNHRPTICRGVLADACGTLLTDFFREKRRLNKKRRAEGEPRRKAKRILAQRHRQAG